MNSLLILFCKFQVSKLVGKENEKLILLIYKLGNKMYFEGTKRFMYAHFTPFMLKYKVDA